MILWMETIKNKEIIEISFGKSNQWVNKLQKSEQNQSGECYLGFSKCNMYDKNRDMLTL